MKCRFFYHTRFFFRMCTICTCAFEWLFELRKLRSPSRKAQKMTKRPLYKSFEGEIWRRNGHENMEKPRKSEFCVFFPTRKRQKRQANNKKKGGNNVQVVQPWKKERNYERERNLGISGLIFKSSFSRPSFTLCTSKNILFPTLFQDNFVPFFLTKVCYSLRRRLSSSREGLEVLDTNFSLPTFVRLFLTQSFLLFLPWFQKEYFHE